MKNTFSHKYLDWILIVISLLFSVDSILILFNEFDFFSTFTLRLIFAFVSVLALISLLVNNLNGERYSRIFIIVATIIPAIIILNQFFTDLIFYGISRTDLLQNPILFLKAIIGIILFILIIKYSRQTKSERRKDYGILAMSIGIFATIFVIIKAIQTNTMEGLQELPLWKLITKSLIGLIVAYFGLRLKNDKIKLKSCIIITLILMLIYNLI